MDLMTIEDDSKDAPRSIPLHVTPDQLEVLISAMEVAGMHFNDLDVPADMTEDDLVDLVDMLEAKAGEFSDSASEADEEEYLASLDDEDTGSEDTDG